jgi:hypothetical protein
MSMYIHNQSIMIVMHGAPPARAQAPVHRPLSRPRPMRSRPAHGPASADAHVPASAGGGARGACLLRHEEPGSETRARREDPGLWECATLGVFNSIGCPMRTARAMCWSPVKFLDGCTSAFNFFRRAINIRYEFAINVKSDDGVHRTELTLLNEIRRRCPSN